jgi:carboxymethylenebutenolidase
MNEYIYQSTQNAKLTESETAIIVLPDIFGQTDYAKQTCEDLASKFKKPTYLLDYFYQLTGKTNIIDQTNHELAVALMQKTTGDDFAAILEQAITDISAQLPKLQRIAVVGFCFGGRLAYLSGLQSKVKTIVSFYGAGALTPNFYNHQTPLAALCDARENDKSLSVLSFYGTQDSTIPPADRKTIKQQLTIAGIAYVAKEYNAGHAYFQPGRDNYNQPAAEASWQDLQKFLS